MSAILDEGLKSVTIGDFLFTDDADINEVKRQINYVLSYINAEYGPSVFFTSTVFFEKNNPKGISIQINYLDEDVPLPVLKNGRLCMITAKMHRIIKDLHVSLRGNVRWYHLYPVLDDARSKFVSRKRRN